MILARASFLSATHLWKPLVCTAPDPSRAEDKTTLRPVKSGAFEFLATAISIWIILLMRSSDEARLEELSWSTSCANLKLSRHAQREVV